MTRTFTSREPAIGYTITLAGKAWRKTRRLGGQAWQEAVASAFVSARLGEASGTAPEFAKVMGSLGYEEAVSRTLIHQWLGPNHRLTLWRVETGPGERFEPVCLGWIKEEGGVWAATTSDYLRSWLLDDRLAAARTLCAHLRIEMPELPAVDGE
jgi:hypothetical protein